MILKRVIWPEPDSEDEDDSSLVEGTCLVTGFLREYIETGQISIYVMNNIKYFDPQVIPYEFSLENDSN